MDEPGRRAMNVRIYAIEKTITVLLKKSSKNDYPKGTNSYINGLADSTRVLNNHKPEYDLPTGGTPRSSGGGERIPSSGNSRNDGGRTSASFLQANDQANEMQARGWFLKGTKGRFRPDITCHLCGFKGHFEDFCPVATNAQGDGIPSPRQNPSPRQCFKGDT